MAALSVLIMEFVFNLMIYLKGLFYEKIYQKTLISIQKSIAGEILNLEIEEIDKNSSGLFIDRLNVDTENIAELFMEYAYWISHIISNVGVLIAIFILNQYMFIYAIVTSLVIYFISSFKFNIISFWKENKYCVTRKI